MYNQGSGLASYRIQIPLYRLSDFLFDYLRIRERSNKNRIKLQEFTIEDKPISRNGSM